MKYLDGTYRLSDKRKEFQMKKAPGILLPAMLPPPFKLNFGPHVPSAARQVVSPGFDT